MQYRTVSHGEDDDGVSSWRDSFVSSSSDFPLASLAASLFARTAQHKADGGKQFSMKRPQDDSDERWWLVGINFLAFDLAPTRLLAHLEGFHVALLLLFNVVVVVSLIHYLMSFPGSIALARSLNSDPDSTFKIPSGAKINYRQ
jgi:hypothetical protein